MNALRQHNAAQTPQNTFATTPREYTASPFFTTSQLSPSDTDTHAACPTHTPWVVYYPLQVWQLMYVPHKRGNTGASRLVKRLCADWRPIRACVRCRLPPSRQVHATRAAARLAVHAHPPRAVLHFLTGAPRTHSRTRQHMDMVPLCGGAAARCSPPSTSSTAGQRRGDLAGDLPVDLAGVAASLSTARTAHRVCIPRGRARVGGASRAGGAAHALVHVIHWVAARRASAWSSRGAAHCSPPPRSSGRRRQCAGALCAPRAWARR